MNYIQIQRMNKELDTLNDFINRLENRLEKNPNDLAAKSELLSFKSRHGQVTRELNFINMILDNLRFDVRIFKSDDGDVNFNLKDEFFYKFQNLINISGEEELNLEVEKSIKGSIDLILAPEVEPDNMFKPLLLENLERLNTLIDCNDNKSELILLKNKYGVDILNEYNALLEFLIDSDVDLELYGNVSPKGFDKKILSVNEAKSIVKSIKSIL